MEKRTQWEEDGFSCEIFFVEGMACGFEIYEIEDPEKHSEGMIESDGRTVTGYDGCYELPKAICDKLEEIGYTLDI